MKSKNKKFNLIKSWYNPWTSVLYVAIIIILVIVQKTYLK